MNKNRFVFFRAFFPSWMFFTEASGDILLEVLTPDGWIRPLPQIQRSLKNIFLNSNNNLIHACNNSLHHLVDDINKISDANEDSILSLPSYKIVRNMALYFIRESIPSSFHFQFRVVVVPPSSSNKKSEIVLTSPLKEDCS